MAGPLTHQDGLHVARGARRLAWSLRWAALRLEGSFWMMRPTPIVYGLVMPAGWLAAGAPPADGKLLATMVAVTLGVGAMQVANDVVDADKDRVTAPELPLPSGVVSLAQATATIGAMTIGSVVLFAVGAESWTAFALGVGTIMLGATLMEVYSYAKEFGLLSSLLAAIAGTSVVLGAYLLAGGGGDSTIVPVLAWALFFWLSSNVIGTLQDVDGDATVGNRTVAVRLGPRRTVELIMLLEVAAHAFILVAAATNSRLGVVAPFAVASLVVVVALFFQARGRQDRPEWRGRQGRVDSVLAPALLRWGHEPLMVAVFSVPLALGTGAAMVVLLGFVVPHYDRRIAHGGLRRGLDRLAGEPA